MKIRPLGGLLAFAIAAQTTISAAQSGVDVTPLPAQAAPQAVPTRTAAQAEEEADQSYAQGRLDAAVAQYEEAAALQTSADEAVRLLVVAASLHHRLGNGDAAVDAMTRALALKPDYSLSAENFSPAFQDVYYEGRRRALDQRARTAQEKVRTGAERLRTHDFAAARAAYRDALALDPTLAPALFGLADVEREQGNTEAALAGYQKLLALRRAKADALPADLQVAALNNLGILYYEKGFYEDAESALAEAVGLDANRAQTWTNLGLARRKLGKRKDATDALRKAYTLDPENETAAGNLALTYIDAANWVDAVALLLGATKKMPENPQLWLNLGIAQQGMENVDGAIGSFAKALELDPANRHGFAASAAGYLAQAYARQGKFDLAEQHAQKQVGWTPQDVTGWVNLGQAQLAAAKTAEARQSLEHALALDPARPEVSNNLGSAYYRLGDYARAADAFQRALTMRGDYLAAADNLGMTKRRLAELDLLDRRLGLKIDTLASGPRGIVLSGVTPNGAGARADLVPGDTIVRVEGNAVTNAADLAAYLALQPPLRSLSCELLRSGKLIKARLKLA